jgi:hypothetical protein
MDDDPSRRAAKGNSVTRYEGMKKLNWGRKGVCSSADALSKG